eukprot:gene9176-6454_t
MILVTNNTEVSFVKSFTLEKYSFLPAVMVRKGVRNPPRRQSGTDQVHLGFCLLYTGLAFRGLQLQTHGPTHETVEGRFLQALADVQLISIADGKPKNNIGVHATRNLVTLYVPAATIQERFTSLDHLADAVNACLPRCIRVAKVSPLTTSFVPRHCCNRRVYRYLLPVYAMLPDADSWDSWLLKCPSFPQEVAQLCEQATTDSKFGCPYTDLGSASSDGDASPWLSRIDAAVKKCNRMLATHVVGTHRFHNFCVDHEVHGKVQFAKMISSWSDEAVRSVHRCEVVPRLYFLPCNQAGPTREDWHEHQEVLSGDLVAPARMDVPLAAAPFLVFQIEGNSFLFNMIRKIVGTMLAVCRGARESVWEDLLCPTRRGCAPLAPGTYLYLALSTYHGYDRGVVGGKFKNARPLQDEWSGPVVAAAESFAWKEIVMDVIDADLNRLPVLESLLLARGAFLSSRRPETPREDTHVKSGTGTKGGMTAPIYRQCGEMAAFLRSLKLHNWTWSEVRIPEKCALAQQWNRKDIAAPSSSSGAVENSAELVEAPPVPVTVGPAAELMSESADPGNETSPRVVDGGEDGWIYAVNTDEEAHALRPLSWIIFNLCQTFRVSMRWITCVALSCLAYRLIPLLLAPLLPLRILSKPQWRETMSEPPIQKDYYKEALRGPQVPIPCPLCRRKGRLAAHLREIGRRIPDVLAQGMAICHLCGETVLRYSEAMPPTTSLEASLRSRAEKFSVLPSAFLNFFLWMPRFIHIVASLVRSLLRPLKNMADAAAEWNDKKKQKLSKTAKKWMDRFFAAWCDPTPSPAPLPFCAAGEPLGLTSCDGFLVLNGGVLASSSPFEVRQLLLDQAAVETRDGDEAVSILRFSAALPFVLVLRPLRLDHLHSVSVAAAPPASVAVPARDVPLKYTVYVVPIPESQRSAHHGCCSNSRGEALLLLPCDAQAVAQRLGHLFQPATVGAERAILAYYNRLERRTSPRRTIASHHVDAIPGLYIIPDFLSPEEHDSIFAELQERDQLHVQYLQRRRVAHFNRRFIYGVNKVDQLGKEVNPNPDFFVRLQRRLHNMDKDVRLSGPLPDFGDQLCDQLTVNYYDYSDKTGRSCGIASHVDAHSAFMDQIFIVSLGSYTLMDFRPWHSPPDAAPIPVYLEPRSLVIMDGEVRYGWEHGIAEKRTDAVSELIPSLYRGDRVSLTWRVAREEPHLKASCPYPALCDGV